MMVFKSKNLVRERCAIEAFKMRFNHPPIGTQRQFKTLVRKPLSNENLIEYVSGFFWVFPEALSRENLSPKMTIAVNKIVNL